MRVALSRDVPRGAVETGGFQNRGPQEPAGATCTPDEGHPRLPMTGRPAPTHTDTTSLYLVSGLDVLGWIDESQRLVGKHRAADSKGGHQGNRRSVLPQDLKALAFIRRNENTPKSNISSLEPLSTRQRSTDHSGANPNSAV